MQSLKNGSRLGDYAIVRLIARGGMGEVFEAHEITLDRRVALKVISPNSDHENSDLVRRFMQEARTLAKVNHPNVVTIHAIQNTAQNQFIAMEYVDGVSIKDFLDEYQMPAEIALFLFEQILSGLKRLHEHNIIHRDLKPSNILIRVDGQIKILDFGIAKSFDGHVNTNPGVAVGTPPYMAPELRDFKSASIRSDFWSLGAIFFECLTGKLLVLFLKENEFRFSKSDLKLIPEAMRAIIGGMSAPSPEDRYANVNEILDDLYRLKQTLGPPSAAALSTFRDQLKLLTESKRPKEAMEPPRTPLFDIAMPVESERMESSIRKLSQSPISKATPMPERRSSRRKRQNRTAYLSGLAVCLLVIALFLTNRLKTMSQQPPMPPPKSLSAVEPAGVVPVQLKEPTDRQLIWLEPAQNPMLTWSRVLSAQEYDLQIALDSEFRRIIVNEPVNGNSFLPHKLIPEGVYYWRLKPAMGSKSPAVRAQNFTLARLEPVVLIKPNAGLSIESATEEGATADFEWACRPGARQYLVQVSADPGFKKLAKSKTVADCGWNTVRLGPGHYHWRVRLEIGTGYREIWSAAREFWITAPPAREKVIELAAPQIKTLRQTFALVGPKPRGLASDRNVPLVWSKVPGAHHYRLQISDSRDFDEPLLDENVSGDRFKWRPLEAGPAYWRVRAVASTGSASKPSVVGVVNVIAPAKPKPLPVAAPSPQPAPEPQAQKSTLHAPNPRNPELGVEAPSRNGRVSLEFSWSRVTEAETYTVEIAADPLFEHVIQHLSSVAPKVLLEQAELSGRVYWRVRAYGDGQSSDWSAPMYFDVK